MSDGFGYSYFAISKGIYQCMYQKMYLLVLHKHYFNIRSMIRFKTKERGLLETGDSFHFGMDIPVCKLSKEIYFNITCIFSRKNNSGRSIDNVKRC